MACRWCGEEECRCEVEKRKNPPPKMYHNDDEWEADTTMED